MKNKVLYIISGVVALIVVALCLKPEQRHYEWYLQKYPTSDGDQPYDTKLFDELMRRSLPNGYDIKALQAVVDPSDDLFDGGVLHLPEIVNASADTSFMVITSYPWRYVDGYNTRFILPIYSLIQHALGGGKSLLLISSYPDEEIYSYSNIMKDLGITNYEPRSVYDYDDEEDYMSYYEQDAVTWLKRRKYKPLKLVGREVDTMTVDNRFVNMLFCRKYCYPLKGPDFVNNNKLRCRIFPTVFDKSDPSKCYVIDIYFPGSGGHVYVSTLGLYFSNLGVATDGCEKLIQQLVSKIDDRPVTRLTYSKEVHAPKSTPQSHRKDSLAVISDNPALSITWNLLLLLMVLALIRGLMRRHPASKDVYQLDKTDPVAVREHKFRRSPLLHFLYQCSWLYKGSSDYEELFRINYRRLCRAVNRATGVELKTASDDDIRQAAITLAAMHDRKADEIISELTWMRDANKPEHIKVNRKQYIYSQQTVEKYARDTF